MYVLNMNVEETALNGYIYNFNNIPPVNCIKPKKILISLKT